MAFEKKKTPEMLDLNYTLPSNLPNKDNILLDQLIYDKVKKFCFPYEVTVTWKLKQKGPFQATEIIRASVKLLSDRYTRL